MPKKSPIAANCERSSPSETPAPLREAPTVAGPPTATQRRARSTPAPTGVDEPAPVESFLNLVARLIALKHRQDAAAEEDSPPPAKRRAAPVRSRS
mgnify:CR=1 FL=1